MSERRGNLTPEEREDRERLRCRAIGQPETLTSEDRAALRDWERWAEEPGPAFVPESSPRD